VPHSCTVGSTVAASASDLGANGILGVGSFLNDGQMYHGCAPTSPFSSCRTYPTATQQVQNPVARFATNNNGVLLKMDAVAADGATRVTGQLIFGIGTQSNNQLGTARIVPTDSNGYFTTTYKGTQLPNSFFDSGSNGLYFDDPDLTACTTIDAGFYCPASLQNLSATVSLAGNSTDVVHFSIGDAAALLASPGWAFSTLGGSMSGPSFDWGLPFFFGRSVFTAIEGRSTPAGVGPLFAYTP
jgi:hypothetical protein